jgi:hypothetical protein
MTFDPKWIRKDLVVKRDGTNPLTGDWEVGDNKKIILDSLQMQDHDGFKITDTSSIAVFTITDAGVTSLKHGVAVNEFSTDSSLSGNSDYAVPTERATKTYVDTVLEEQFYERLLDSSIYLNGAYDTFRTTTDINTGVTTMTQSVANHMYSASASGQVLQSNNLYDSSTSMAAITQALLYVDYSVAGHTFQLSANGGTNWETVTPNQVYYFTNTGLDLRIKITSGAADDFRSWGVLYNSDFTQPAAMTRWTPITANYSAQDGDKLLVKTASSAITITLPSIPTVGDEIRIVDASVNFGTNNCTLSRNGNKIEEVADDFILDTDRSDVTLVYVDSTTGWRVIND